MTLDQAYFDTMYAASPDPWGFATRWYERRKHAISVAMLPRERYACGFEPGASIGILTGLLADRCDSLLAWDVAPAAVTAARQRLAGRDHVRVERGALPGDWPSGEFDLIVLSEILYYFAGADLQRALDRAVTSLRPGGHLLAVHWRHPVPEYPRSGDNVHAALARQGGLSRLAEHREADFIADVYASGEPVSVAQATGLA